MVTNFELKDSIAIKFSEHYIDLHNNFNFIGYEYDILARQIILKWTKSKGDWVHKNEFSSLQLIHSDVSFLTISYNNSQYEIPNDDKCLSFISFFSSADRITNNGWIEQNKPSEADDILYSFETEHFIRVGCDKIDLICQ